MKYDFTRIRQCALAPMLAGCLTGGLLAGCATEGRPPPVIALDEPAPAVLEPPVPALAAAVEVPKPLPLPGQLKPLAQPAAVPEPADEKRRVSRANEEARVVPTREGYLNAIQVWPFADGALYQVYASPGRVTLIALEPGEELVAVSAGDTVRWIVGDTTSGSGASQRVNVLVKPVRTGLRTNLVITTDRRTYLLELTATPQAWMASVSWDYPKDKVLALRKEGRETREGREASATSVRGLVPEQLRFRYAISGDSPPWKPLRAFDDGGRVYIQFPGGIAQGELPPLFVVGPQGDAQLVNHRYRAPYYVVDRLFGAAELRLGGANQGRQEVVRIERNDGVPAGRAGGGDAGADGPGRGGGS